MYVGDYIGRRALYSGDDLALVDLGDNGRKYTFNQLNDRANRVGHWLGKIGLEKGDRAGILAMDGIHHYDLFYACGKTGCVSTPYNWRLHPKEVLYQVQVSKPKVFIHSDEDELSEIVSFIKTKAPHVTFIQSDELEEELATSSSAPITCESLTETDTLCLLFTGGTTGLPKAAQISHRQVVWNIFNTEFADVKGTDSFLNVFPMFHTGGLFVFATPIQIMGGTIYQTKGVDPDQLLTVIQDEKLSLFAAVPSVYQMMTQSPSWAEADLSSLRYCISGGAPMPVPLMKKYQQEKNVVFRQGFGLTEFGPADFILSAEDSERKAGSIGKPNFFVDAKVVDPETNETKSPDEIGELCLRGPMATTGYFENPEATAALFDDENYLHTGDMAKVDDEGYFYIVDRLKDMFLSGGENVFPAEIEKVLYENSDVEMCAVVGIPNEKWGEVGCAFIVKNIEANPTEKEIIDYLKNNLAKYKVPQEVRFIEEMPLSGPGKILKTELRKMVVS